MSRFFHRVATSTLVLAAFVLAGCCSQNCAPVTGHEVNSFSSSKASGLVAATSADYQAAPGDTLKITIYGENDLSGDYIVGPDSTIALPLVGAINVSGLSLSELPGTVAMAYRGDYLKDPKVSVEVKGRSR